MKQLMLFFGVLLSMPVLAQNKASMKWFNQPQKWEHNGETITFDVHPDTDYWQVTHYGFQRDNGPFYYTEMKGDFEATVKVSGAYKELFHQAGLMIRTDYQNWIKTGIEFVDGVQNVSAVVTHKTSDWSVVPRNDNPAAIWLKLLRKGDYVQVEYSFDGKKYQMLRLAYFEPKVKVQIGVVAAAPGKLPFQAKFVDFKVKAVQ